MSTTHHESGPDSDLDLRHDLEEHEVLETGGPVGVSVHHDVRWPALVALACAVLTVLGFSRALSTADPLDCRDTLIIQ